MGRNDAAGSTDAIDQCPACAGRDEPGPEHMYSYTAATAETVTFPAEQGETYYIVAEGYQGGVGDCDLTVTCY